MIRTLDQAVTHLQGILTSSVDGDALYVFLSASESFRARNPYQKTSSTQLFGQRGDLLPQLSQTVGPVIPGVPA